MLCMESAQSLDYPGFELRDSPTARRQKTRFASDRHLQPRGNASPLLLLPTVGASCPERNSRRRVRDAFNSAPRAITPRVTWSPNAKEETMPLYLSKFSYTPETWARLIGNPRIAGRPPGVHRVGRRKAPRFLVLLRARRRLHPLGGPGQRVHGRGRARHHRRRGP